MFQATYKSKRIYISVLNLTYKQILQQYQNRSHSYLLSCQVSKQFFNITSQKSIQKNAFVYRNFHLNAINSNTLRNEESSVQPVENLKNDKGNVQANVESLTVQSNDYIPQIKNLSVRRNVLALVEDSEDVDFIAPQVRPTFNLAAYADKSDMLKSLIQLGVNISKWDEKHKDISTQILCKNFENDIQPYIFFLHNLGVPADGIGKWFTANPYIVELSFKKIQFRIDYLKSKRFTDENITRILVVTPLWINHSVVDIDKRLGQFQRRFKLSNKDVVQLAVRDPKLILFKMKNSGVLEKIYQSLEGLMGFTDEEQKNFVLNSPRIYRTDAWRLHERFNLLHNEAGFPHYMIVKFPKVLGLRERKIRERYQFLKMIGKDQYNPKKTGYVSPKDFSIGTDAEFSTNVAKCSIEVYNDFLKTL